MTILIKMASKVLSPVFIEAERFLTTAFTSNYSSPVSEISLRNLESGLVLAFKKKMSFEIEPYFQMTQEDSEILNQEPFKIKVK